jgi:hypothetical protein
MPEIISQPKDVDFSAQINSASSDDLPLLFTSKGNIPVDALRYETEWITDPKYIMFCEKWFLIDELVKSNSHVYGHNPADGIGSSQQSF